MQALRVAVACALLTPQIALGASVAPAASAATSPRVAVAVNDERTILVPAGTAIPVHVVGTISSGSAKKGDTFQIQAADDVIVNDMIVVPRGAGGEGTIVDADSAGGNGHSGSLALSFSFIHSADGGRIRLSDATQTHSEDDRKGASSTATIIGFATFGIGGLFGHNLAHGKQKTVDDSAVLRAFTAETVHVAASEHVEREHYDK